MPNHCWNTLTVIGHEADVKELLESEFKFSTFLPVPASVEKSSESFVHTEWCTKHWGTKWEHWDYKQLHESPNACEVQFTTAWCPPFEFLRHLLERFPRCWFKLTFKTEAEEAGIWIAYNWKEELIERKMFWVEPMPALTADGEIYIPHDLTE